MVTALSMLHDLKDSDLFVKDIKNLTFDGIFILEHADLSLQKLFI